MKMTTEHRKKTGAFYTPERWANLAVEKIRDILPYPEDFVFYDPAAGEGALLEALPDWVEKYGSTLEAEDARICQQKGLKVIQMDFFNDKLPEKPTNKPLAVFMNPPYFKLKKDHDCFARRKYNEHDSVFLFYHRLLSELKPDIIFSFNKTEIFIGSMSSKFREATHILDKHIYMFLTPSKTWGLAGSFAIAFNVFLLNDEILINNNYSIDPSPYMIECDVYGDECEYINCFGEVVKNKKIIHLI